MAQPVSWSATAFNQATESSNQIHSDEMAKAYGFRGGLVPGVTISSYLIHPAVVAWGEDWLSRGYAKVVVTKPLYDGFEFEVIVSNATDQSYDAVLIDSEGTRCAHAQISLTENPGPAPVRRGDPLLAKDAEIPTVAREVFERMADTGMAALPARWHADNNMATYLKDRSQMLPLHRFDGGGYANAAYMLSLTNWVLAGNTYMNPWVHVQTESQFFAPVPAGSDLIVECAVKDLFERKGHEFVDVKVDAYIRDTDQAVMTADLRAIYKLRTPEG